MPVAKRRHGEALTTGLDPTQSVQSALGYLSPITYEARPLAETN